MFSLVNKTWNYEAKSLLKARESVVAALGTSMISSSLPAPARREANVCEDLEKFATATETMNVIPYSGLKINFNPASCEPYPFISPFVTETVCSRVPMKILKFESCDPIIGSFHQANLYSGAELLVHCLSISAKQLVEVSIVGSASLFLDCLGENVFRQEFPLLKSFHFDVADWDNDVHWSWLCNIIGSIGDSSPRLKQLDVGNSFCLYAHQNRKDGTDERLIEFCVTTALKQSKALLVWKVNPFEPAILSFKCLRRLAVRKLCPYSHSWKNYEAGLKIIRNSRQTLTSAACNIVSLAETLLDGMTFPNLTELALDVNFFCLREGFKVLRDGILDVNAWKRGFPNLKTLKFYTFEAAPEPEFLNKLEERFQHARRNLTLEASGSGLQIEKLDLTCKYLNVTTEELRLISALCPQVKQLAKCQRLYDGSFPLGYGLKCIEYLELEIRERFDLDGLLCGVSYEELKELKEKDVEYLKAVHIIPGQPSITHLTCKSE